jgi:hypothetical protein
VAAGCLVIYSDSEVSPRNENVPGTHGLVLILCARCVTVQLFHFLLELLKHLVLPQFMEKAVIPVTQISKLRFTRRKPSK